MSMEGRECSLRLGDSGRLAEQSVHFGRLGTLWCAFLLESFRAGFW